MADCSYARCIQERRHIRRELLRWTKNMVYVVGLERVAEELMGRRRWKLYQDSLYNSSRSEAATHPHHMHPPSSCNPPSNTNQFYQPLLTTQTPLRVKHEPQLPNHDETDKELEKRAEDSRLRLQDIKVEVVERDQDQEEDQEEKGKGAEETARVDSGEANPLRISNSLHHLERSQANDTERIEEQTQEIALERIQVPQGLLRVKKEEELQAIPGSLGVVLGVDERIRLGPGCKEVEGLGAITENSVRPLPFLGIGVTNRRSSPPPEDWKPLDKCYFCLDGKLPHEEQPPLSPQSESSSSSRSADSPMSVQVDPSMVKSLAAVAALSGVTGGAIGYPTLLPQWCLPPRETPHSGVPGQQENASAADQPLDLSAKPKSSQDINISLLEQQRISLRMQAGIDPKSIFNSCYRAKPRMTGPSGAGGVPVVGAGTGRRSYTEEELQAALRDIQSGKLGTRRAAVIYGIPRSTLRNKVYKLAMERDRETSLTSLSHPHESSAPTTPNATQNASTCPATTPPPQADEIDDKELSGAEEEKEVEKALLKPLLSLEDLVRFSALEGSGGDSLRTLLQRGPETGTEWPGFEHANIGPYIQRMLAAAAPFKGVEPPDYRIPEVMRRLMSEDKRLSKDMNGEHQLPPITNDDFNPSIEEEASDSAQSRAILKIPSYKPASTPGSSKNGEPSSAAFAQGFAVASSAAGSPGLLERASPAFSGTSSPTNSLVGKGVGVNFRDVIAKSISVKFQEGQGLPPGVVQPPMMGDPNPFKRGRYTPPQPQAPQPQPPKPSQEIKPKPGAGGKGTRPKRGKYRNYDRDSLVEAVRAVQRGEMSVHRAGSYYGVPHSTLEYKVKERHLMRPRKRDQKPPDDKAKEAAAAAAAMRQGGPDKKPQLKPQKTFTPPGPIPGPNGMKMPPFMEGMPHLPFAHPFNFWGPAPFIPSPFMTGAPNVPTMLPEQYFATQRMRGLQEQQRNAIVQQQQHQQQQQQQQHQQQQHREREGISGPPEPGTSNSRGGPGLGKSTREMAESLYDGTGTNGSFLDNLIRSSLETGLPRDQRALAEARSQQHHPEAMSNKALIDQLCRNSSKTPLPRVPHDSSEDESYRGQGRALPERPERVPTVDLSPSPSERGRPEDGSDRLTSPPTPSSISRAGSRDDETRDSRVDRSSREREVHNGQEDHERDRDRERVKTMTLQQQLNHYPDLHNLYAVSTDKSACDSKLIVDQSSQKTQQQKKEYAAVSGLVAQLQRGYNPVARTGEQTQNNQPPERATVLKMEDSVEQ